MASRGSATSLRRLAVTLAALGLAVVSTGPVAAQTLTVSGSPALLHITTAVAGSAPTLVSNTLTTYTTKTSGSSPQKITVQLNSNMPAGTTLTVNMAAVTGATSNGTLSLTTTAQSAVGNITNTVNKTAAVTYTFSATSAAGVIASSTRTVTLTLLVYP